MHSEQNALRELTRPFLSPAPKKKERIGSGYARLGGGEWEVLKQFMQGHKKWNEHTFDDSNMARKFLYRKSCKLCLMVVNDSFKSP